MQKWVKPSLIALPLVIVAGWWLVGSKPVQERPDPVTVIEPEVLEPVPEVQPEPPVVKQEPPKNPIDNTPPVPPVPTPEKLNGSDVVVQSTLENLAPTLLKWLVPEEQVRKWVLVVDLMAEGEVPKRHQPWVYAMDTFKVMAKEGDWPQGEEKYLAKAANQTRLTPFVDALVAIPPRTLGRYYRAWLPTLEQAYDELGKPGSFSERVDLAVKRLSQVQERPDDAVLERPHVFYQYQDSELEQASPLEKALWRAGDENREKLQAYLDQLKFYL